MIRIPCFNEIRARSSSCDLQKDLRSLKAETSFATRDKLLHLDMLFKNEPADSCGFQGQMMSTINSTRVLHTILSQLSSPYAANRSIFIESFA